jgi:hypothetical protein
MRLRPTKSTIAVLAALLGLILVASGSFFWLQRGWLAEASTQLQDREAELYDGQRIAKRRDAAAEALQQARTMISTLEPGVNDASYVPTFLKQIEALAINTKNRVIGVRPQVIKQAPTKIEQRRDPDAQGKEGGAGGKEEKEEKPEPYTRLEVEINLIGRYPSSQKFVNELMRFPKIISVDQVQLRPHHGSETDRSLLEVQLKLTAFIMKQQTPAGEVKAASLASADVEGIN